MSIASIVANFAGPGDAFRVEDGFAVYDNALLFKAGDYPDKDFAITPEEMAAAVSSFSPVKGDLDHSGWLKGKALEVRKVWVDPKDSSLLRGVVAVPEWLNGALKDTQKKLSAEWNKATKTLRAMALCTNPYIDDAALVAAFTASTGGADPREIAELRTHSEILRERDRQAKIREIQQGGISDSLEARQAKLAETKKRVDMSCRERTRLAEVLVAAGGRPVLYTRENGEEIIVH